MARYETNNELGGSQQALAAAYKTLVSVFATSGALSRGIVSSIMVGTNGTPSNNALEFDVARMTVDGTGTAVTPNPLEPRLSACSATSKANYTVEPTVTANSSLWYMGINQQATYRWIAADDDDALIFPATANNGLVLRARASVYTGTATGGLRFDE